MMNLNRFVLFLKCIDGIGDAFIRKMIQFGCFKNIELKTKSDILEWLKHNAMFFSKKLDVNILNSESLEKAKEKRQDIETKLSNIGASYISYFDKRYPDRFKEMKATNDFPIILFYKGNVNLLNEKKMCAIIGTREPSIETEKIGYELGKYMVEKGYTIVSGLAIGCDTIGHKSCLDNGGKTIAIMGTGIDSIYPKKNADLAKRILDNDGLLVTEEIVGFKGAAYSFVNRDRLQASCSDIVITLETNIDGGAMHASKAAIQKYHHLLAALDPSVIPNGKTSGNKELITFFGAKAIKKLEDIDEIL